MTYGSLHVLVGLGIIPALFQPTKFTRREVNYMLRNFFAREEGQGLVEYALILVLIAIVVIGILSILGNRVSTVFSQINSGLSK